MSVKVPVAIPLNPTNHTTLGISHPAFAAISKDGVTLSYKGKANHTHDAGAARTIAAIPANYHMAYFEAKVVSSGTKGNMRIGFIGKDSPLNRNVGATPNSYGYSGNDGRFHTHGKQCNGVPKGTPTYSTGDTVGCGVHYEERFVFFTKNGSLVGTVDLDLPEPERFTLALGQNATIAPKGYRVMQDPEMLGDPFLYGQDDTAHDAEHDKTKISGGAKQTSMTNRQNSQMDNAGVFSSEYINPAKATSSNVPFGNVKKEMEIMDAVFDARKQKVDAVKGKAEIPLLCRHDRATQLYPAVSVHSPGECIRVVFNPSHFLFQVQVFSEEIKDRIGKQILTTGNSFDLLQNVVHNYLRMNGYQKTWRVLNRNHSMQSKAASSRTEQDLLGGTTKHDVTTSASVVSMDNMDDNLGVRANLRGLIISNKLKEAQIFIQEQFLAYHKHEKIQYLFRVLEYINIVRKSYPKTKVEYFRRKEMIQEKNKNQTKSAQTDGQSKDHEKLLLLNEHVKMLNKSMMENLNLKTNYHLDPATLSILNAADDGSEKNIEEEEENEINIFKLLGMDTDKYCLGDDYLYDKYIVEATGFAKKHFRASDCLVAPLMGLLAAPDYDYLMNQKYRVEVADEINGILVNLEYYSDMEAMNNNASWSTQTTKRKDYHFRLDEKELKRKKEELEQDMNDVFGPALPPEMYIDRYESLLHEHMNDNVKQYVVDVPSTELRNIVEHTIATKSIIDTI